MSNDSRIEFKNPVIAQMRTNMMLRIGGRRQASEKWAAAISLQVLPDGPVRVMFNPGGTEEYTTWISVEEIRLAWSVPGVDFYRLCHQSKSKFLGIVEEQYQILH